MPCSYSVLLCKLKVFCALPVICGYDTNVRRCIITHVISFVIYWCFRRSWSLVSGLRAQCVVGWISHSVWWCSTWGCVDVIPVVFYTYRLNQDTVQPLKFAVCVRVDLVRRKLRVLKDCRPRHGYTTFMWWNMSRTAPKHHCIFCVLWMALEFGAWMFVMLFLRYIDKRLHVAAQFEIFVFIPLPVRCLALFLFSN